MHVVYYPKFCISIFVDFSWDDSGKIGNNGFAKFWGVNKVHYGLCENGE